MKEKCEFYPNEKELEEFGPFCDAGSDVSGSFLCTKEYGEMCQWANEERERRKKDKD